MKHYDRAAALVREWTAINEGELDTKEDVLEDLVRRIEDAFGDVVQAERVDQAMLRHRG